MSDCLLTHPKCLYHSHSTSMTGLSSRPARSSLHSASVHISSLTQRVSVVNPQPWDKQDQTGSSSTTEPLNQGYLSPMKLVQLTEEPDLHRVTYLELSIDTSESSVGNFGKSPQCSRPPPAPLSHLAISEGSSRVSHF